MPSRPKDPQAILLRPGDNTEIEFSMPLSRLTKYMTPFGYKSYNGTWTVMLLFCSFNPWEEHYVFRFSINKVTAPMCERQAWYSPVVVTFKRSKSIKRGKYTVYVLLNFTRKNYNKWIKIQPNPIVRVDRTTRKIKEACFTQQEPCIIRMLVVGQAGQ